MNDMAPRFPGKPADNEPTTEAQPAGFGRAQPYRGDTAGRPIEPPSPPPRLSDPAPAPRPSARQDAETRAPERPRTGHVESPPPPLRRPQPPRMPGEEAAPRAAAPPAEAALKERQPNRRAPDPAGESADEQARPSTGHKAIGRIFGISGSASSALLDAERLKQCQADEDPSVQLAGLVGSQIKVRVGKTWLLASVRAQSQDTATGQIVAEIDFLGEGEEEKLTGRVRNFRRGITHYPMPGSEVYAATDADLKQVYASDGRANVTIGTVFPTKDIKAGLYVDAMLGKHFAQLGSTGTGKSTSAALILHRICDVAPEGHIVMIDPHGEYAAAFKSNGEILNVTNLRMPYWLMNFDEHCEVFIKSSGADRQNDLDILAKCLLKARSKNRLAENMSKLTVDSPIPYLLSDLTNAIQDEMGKLDKATNTAPYMRVKTKIEEIKADPRYQFMFSGMLVADTMSDFIQRIFRMPGGGRPISIIDVSGVPSEITSTVVAMLSRMVFDFAIWGREERGRPILLVCEEAHRYVPNERNADGSSVGNILSRIAKEGRKYGISLGLITQRPSDLAEGVLSQCGTILSMRLNNERDQDFVKAAMPEGAHGFLASIPALRNRECIVCGEGTAIPMRVVFDDLEERKRPASEDPSFSELWQQTGGEEEAVDRIVTRWRSQSR